VNERVGREPLEKREGAVKREWAGGTPFLLLLCSPVLGLGAASFARVSAQGGRVADPPREVRALGGGWLILRAKSGLWVAHPLSPSPAKGAVFSLI